MHFLFVPLLLAVLGLPLSVIAATTPLCDGLNRQVIAAAWYEGWAAATITPESIPFDKLDVVTFAFALVSF